MAQQHAPDNLSDSKTDGPRRRVGSGGRRNPGSTPFSKILAATRLHLPPEARELPEATIEHLRGYIEQAKNLGVRAAIAVNGHEEAVRQIAEEFDPDFRLQVLSVPCWGAFVPALNTLLGFAQRSGMAYILYQSLEVRCSPSVLEWLFEFQSNDTLVVGPELPGHNFLSGERPLNGRTVPWNTLALWSVRKLSLTGFLHIADGLGGHQLNGDVTGTSASVVNRDHDSGDEDWWNFDGSTSFSRQASSEAQSVPAGVEEVTAVALLQHLHGTERARATLVKLPKDLLAETSWSTSWGKDERRAKWHAYKMASKVSRPAAQLQELFKGTRPNRALSVPSELSSMVGTLGDRVTTGFRMRSKEINCGGGTTHKKEEPVGNGVAQQQAQAEKAEEADAEPTPLTYGVVMHYGETILPQPSVKWICLASYGLFYMNSAAVFTSAFKRLNAATLDSSGLPDRTQAALAGAESFATMTFVAFLIGGVYLPMPFSLWLTRNVSRHHGHRAGMALFGVTLLFSHTAVVLSQLLGSDWSRSAILLLARTGQGLGSGVLFLARFVLASVSTSDQHVELQSWAFLFTDFGLGIGALLPPALSVVPGCREIIRDSPDFLTSLVLALLTFIYLVILYIRFPSRLAVLSDRVRCTYQPTDATKKDAIERTIPARKELDTYRATVLLSGTARVFVQSAILPAAALSMRDAGWIGNFRQTFAVASLCLLPMPFEAVATRLSCGCLGGPRQSRDNTQGSKIVSGGIGAVALFIAGAMPRSLADDQGEILALFSRIAELFVLMVALAMAAPFNATRLYQLHDAEYTTALLEWLEFGWHLSRIR